MSDVLGRPGRRRPGMPAFNGPSTAGPARGVDDVNPTVPATFVDDGGPKARDRFTQNGGVSRESFSRWPFCLDNDAVGKSRLDRRRRQEVSVEVRKRAEHPLAWLLAPHQREHESLGVVSPQRPAEAVGGGNEVVALALDVLAQRAESDRRPRLGGRPRRWKWWHEIVSGWRRTEMVRRVKTAIFRIFLVGPVGRRCSHPRERRRSAGRPLLR